MKLRGTIELQVVLNGSSGMEIGDHQKCKPSDTDDSVFFNIVIPVFCLIGATCGLFHFFVLRSHRFFPEATYVYMSAMAIYHVLAIVSESLILMSVNFSSRDMIFYLSEMAFAYIFWPIFNFSSTVALCILAVTSGHLYFSIRNPKTDVVRDRRQARRVVILISVVVAILDSPRNFAYTFSPRIGCFVQRWSTDAESWFTIITYLRLAFFNTGVMLVLTLFQMLLASIVVGHRQDYKKRSSIESADNNKSAALDDERQQQAVAVSDGEFTQQVHFASCMIVFSSYCIFSEFVAILFNPITVAVFWENFKVCKIGWDELTTAAKGLSLLYAGEYSLLFILAIIFNNHYRQALVDKFTGKTVVALPQSDEQRLSASSADEAA